MCDCIDKVNAKLATRNTRLVEAIVFGNRKAPTIMLQTEVVEKKRGAKPVSMFLTHCPFCGEEYPQD